MLNAFGGNSFFDLLGSFKFWLCVAIVVILIVIIIYSFKYPKIGGPVILALLSLALIGFTAYCGIQINYYYKSEGGIHGKITGIFKTNEVEIVDNMTFEFKNIELKQQSNGDYSASVSIDEVLSLNTKNNLGVFINGMPCDVTSKVHEDYAIAKYIYTFYDNDETAILTDTLTLNFAFYDNSTYLSLSTSGGSEAIKLWHYYFNKNGFIVKIAPFDYNDSELGSGTGDVNNYAIVSYSVEDEIKANQVYSVGSKLNLLSLDIEDFMSWQYNGETIKSGYTVTGNMVLTAKLSYDYDVTFYVGDYLLTTQVVSLENCASTENLSSGVGYFDNYAYRAIDYWTLDGSTKIDVDTYPITEDTTFYAVYHIEYRVDFMFEDTYTSVSVVDGGFAIEPTLPDNYVLEYWTIDNVEVDITTYPITTWTIFTAVGHYEYEVNFVIDDKIVESQTVIKGNYPTEPESDFELEAGLELLGWSLDGLTLVDVSTVEITQDITFVALLNNVEYTLTVNTLSETLNYTGLYGETITLETPTLDGHNFVGWEITSGTGLINGNEFTFADGNCEISALFDFCYIYVKSDSSFEITYSDGTSETVTKQSGALNATWGNEEEYSETITITVSAVSAEMTLVDSYGGDVTITQTSDTTFVVSWENVSYISLNISTNNITTV